LASESDYKGLAFLVGGTYMATMLSSYMSSPWTIRNVGADPEHAGTAKILIAASILAGATAAWVASSEDGNWWPMWGGLFTGATFVFAYAWALKGAQEKGYSGLNMGMSQKGGQ
jgi:hypothetical protein